MGRKKKLGLTIFSLLLWAQLVFSVGITFWRYSLVTTGEAELFVSSSPRGMEPLLEVVEVQCASDAALIFHGDEANFYYAQYQLYPRRLARIRLEEEIAANGQLSEIVESIFPQVEHDICLMVDYLPDQLFPNSDHHVVDRDMVVYIIPK